MSARECGREDATGGENLRLFFMNEAALRSAKCNLQAGDELLRTALQPLTARADGMATGPLFSVMDKKMVPPSGDKHDYYSVGPYWWPDPQTASGLPYIRRDGLNNPDAARYDHASLRKFWQCAETLALAYFYTDEEKYALQGVNLLRTWFLDEDTRMNPHLEFGQAIPGICQGRGIGIIESHIFIFILEAAALLAPSRFWTQEDQNKLEDWFGAYTLWLLESDCGKEEAGEHNNHGTYYDLQLAAFALFSGNSKLAERLLRERAVTRMDAQIEADGKQPHEAARTLGLSYSLLNLDGFFMLAALSRNFGLPLWETELPGGGSLRKALDFLVPFLTREKPWPYQQIKPLNKEIAYRILRKASNQYGSLAYEQAALALDAAGYRLSPVQLMYPPAISGGQ